MLPIGQFHFNSVRTLGEGGLGIVDEIVVTASNCQHPVGARFARKRLNDRWKSQPEAQERFEREIAAIGRMCHPAIISFQGENLPGQLRFYVMPIYPQSLRDYLKANPGGVHWVNVAQFGAGLASALHHAHLLGYIHRDLKPENILLDPAGSPVISDWGLGYFVHRDSKVLDLTRGGFGTEYYCSAEQWISGKCDARGDIYSLGVVLAELVRGANRIPMLPGCGIGQDAVLGNAAGSLHFNQYLKKMTSMAKEGRPDHMRQVCTVLNQLAGASMYVA